MDLPNRLLQRIEERGLWPFFHKDWLLQIRAAVRPQLPSEYAVFVESETVILAPAMAEQKAIEPDVLVARGESPVPAARRRESASQAVIELEETCELATGYSLLIRHSPDNRLVAACELVSPTNKGVHGATHRRSFLDKREQYLLAGINLLEIDPLLGGDRLLPERVAGLGAWQRSAWTVLHRGQKRLWRGFGWNEADRLPVVAWGIEGDLVAEVDLDATLREAVAFNPWERMVESPPPG